MRKRLFPRSLTTLVVASACLLWSAPSRGGASCKRWSIEGFSLGMTEDEARSIIAKDASKASRDQDSLHFEIRSRTPKRSVRGQLRIADGAVVAGWVDVTAEGFQGTRALADSLIQRLGKPVRDAVERKDTKNSQIVREWVDADCGVSLVVSYRAEEWSGWDEKKPLRFELRPDSEYRREESARTMAAREKADRATSGSPCSPEPLDANLLDEQPVLVAGSPTRFEATPEALKAREDVRLEVKFLVQADGTVGEVKVVEAPEKDYGLVKSVTKTLQARHYVPGTCGGKPVATWLTQTAAFTFEN